MLYDSPSSRPISGDCGQKHSPSVKPRLWSDHQKKIFGYYVANRGNNGNFRSADKCCISLKRNKERTIDLAQGTLTAICLRNRRMMEHNNLYSPTLQPYIGSGMKSYESGKSKHELSSTPNWRLMDYRKTSCGKLSACQLGEGIVRLVSPTICIKFNSPDAYTCSLRCRVFSRVPGIPRTCFEQNLKNITWLSREQA